MEHHLAQRHQALDDGRFTHMGMRLVNREYDRPGPGYVAQYHTAAAGSAVACTRTQGAVLW